MTKQIINEQLSEGYGIIPRSIMRNKELKIIEKSILAYMLSFTGAGKNVCWPSLKTIAEELGVCKNTIIKNINNLQIKGYVAKGKLDESNYNSVNKYSLLFECTTGEKYKIDLIDGSPDEPDSSCNEPYSSPDELLMVHQMNTNINSNNINNNNNIKSKRDNSFSSKSNPKKEKEQTPRRIVAEDVKLTDAERDRLIAEYGIEQYKKMIERLSLYKGATGKKYVNDYKAIKIWVIDAVKERAKPSGFDDQVGADYMDLR